MATGDLGTKRIRAYCYPFWKIFRIGWVIVQESDPTFLYCDDAPTLTVYSSDSLKYMTIGFTESGVLRRLKKYVESIC